MASRSHMRNNVATWSLRDRPARNRPPRSSPTRSIRPRSSAPCTSSSVGSGPNEPSATSFPKLSSPARSPSRCSSVSNPAPRSTRACALDAVTSYGASAQSKCVDLLSAASASDGPEANRPPHSEPSLVVLPDIYRPRSRLAEILELRPCSWTKPLAALWSKLSPSS
ncbi:Uncharacterised protein [Mycobacteroides abscessus subsp. abscessus]|nr:Uncharacterised protein [Mycobacteroides abscessus subsp. abscessus]